ncbi:phage distal tail protein [Streptomyces europaeiscabiei]|uniref:phage distal tail protein n=1 Tax=Streptomyces europaeiscabiei TaxID=146819 RepID=UPI0029A2DC97|nr:phage tail domain-containing protein [Streptomyces europaeiscabiei]MDX3841728.1 phage tail family protein [Streptomyces europaeiscabiei]
MAAGDQVTRPGHVQYGDLLLGPGTPYRWRSIGGWEDLPGLDSGTVARSDAHGAFPGRLLAQARTVTLDGLIVRAPRATIGAVVAALGAGTVPVEDERPLVVWLDERGPLLAYARATRRAVPAGLGYRLGTITGGAIEFQATDPRRYELAERTVSATLPMSEAGLSWPLSWPLPFGNPGSTGALSTTNVGDAETHPVVEFRGPVTRPSLTSLATGDAVEYDMPLAAGDVLTVDTLAGTVVLNGTASRIYTATSRSVPEQTFTLAPGISSLIFRAAPGSNDPTASATVRYRSAYW